jgi:hypothetical protein
MSFLDPAKPLATCSSENCDNCPAGEHVHCHFRPKELFHFLTIAMPAFLVGGAAVLHSGGWWLGVWLALIFGYFGFLEIRVMCSHCPHYAEEGKSLQCWANHGSPKLWKYRPGPMSLIEKTLFLGGFVVIWGYPLPFLLVGAQWFQLLLYAMLVTGFFLTLKEFLCSQCINFACPLNGVDEAARLEFFKKNPIVAKAWGVEV